MEVSDVYGLNMTYEVARVVDREEPFFVCSLSTCNLNGECIVQVSAEFKVISITQILPPQVKFKDKVD